MLRQYCKQWKTVATQRGYRDNPETFQCIVRLHSSHEHSLCLLWQKHSLGQGLVPCLPKCFMIKYQSGAASRMAHTAATWASNDHHTPCLGQADGLSCTRDRHTRPAHGLSQGSLQLPCIFPSFYLLVAEDTLQLSQRNTQSILDPKSGAEFLLL